MRACYFIDTTQLIIPLFLHMWTLMVTRSILCIKYQSLPWKSVFPQDEMWHCHKTRHGIYTRHGISKRRNYGIST